MNIQSLLNYSNKKLKQNLINSAMLDSEILLQKVIKKDILVKDLKSYDEILLVGSGKGIASIKTIKQINWKRKNLKKFKVLSKYYQAIIKKCRPYSFK